MTHQHHRPVIHDHDLTAALTAFERAPSSEALGHVIRQLARAEIGAAQHQSILELVSDRMRDVPKAEAGSTPFTLHHPRERDVFLALPLTIRQTFRIWLGHDLPAWQDECPQCGGEVDRSHDSYGLPTYTYLYRCLACGWRADQRSNEPTMAEFYSQMHREEDERKRREVTDQISIEPLAELTLDTIAEVVREPSSVAARLNFADMLDARGHGELASSIKRERDVPLRTCWPLCGTKLDPSGWYGPLVALLGDLKSSGTVREVIVSHGWIDHVTLDAAAFLARGRALLTSAPIRSITLLEPDAYLGDIFASPLLEQIVGLGLPLARSETAIAAAIVRARRLPRLRHLDLGTEHVFDLDELKALARADSLVEVTCLHIATWALLYCDDSDWVPYYSWNAFGESVRELERASGRAWFRTILAPAEGLTGHEPFPAR